MNSLQRRPIWKRVGSSVATAAALAFVFFALHPPILAQRAGERWVGTWATAEVARPQNPLPPAPAPTPVAPPAGQTFAPLPFTHFTNQTLRQIVHTSIGGSKARVVLTNAYGTAPVTVGAAYVPLRAKEGAIQ